MTEDIASLANEPSPVHSVYMMNPPRGVYCGGEINDHPIAVGVDTLSYYNLVSLELLEKLDVSYVMRPADCILQGATGTSMKIVGMTEVTLCIA